MVGVTNPLRGIVDPAVNLSHSLNRSRIVWCLTRKLRYGGNALWDLMGGGRYFSLTSMGNSSNGWRPPTRPGADGDLLFDGSAGCLTVGLLSQSLVSLISPLCNIAGAFSLAAWAYCTNVSSGSPQIVSIYSVNSPNYAGIGLGLNISSGGFKTFCYTGNNVWTAPSGSPTTWSASTWYRVLVTCTSGGTLTFYLNGKPDGGTQSVTPPIANNAITNAAAQTFRIGSQPGSTAGNFWPGRIDDVSVWNRALSAAEVKADYDLSRRNYPGVLRMMPEDRETIYVPSAVAGTKFRRTLFDRTGSRGVQVA